MTPTNLEHEPEAIRSFDDTLIAVRRFGAGDRTPVLVVNAVGANLAVWRKALIDIVREREVVAWDLRGLHASGLPRTERVDAAAHAEDAIAVLDHCGFDRVAIASWSTGTRIALEVAHRYPERILALVLACGGYGYPPGRMRFLEVASLLPLGAGAAKHFAHWLEAPFRNVIARPELAGLVRQSGWVGPTADVGALVDLLRAMAECDLRQLLAVYDAVVGDGGRHLLPDIEAPTLLIAGGRDPFTTLRMMRETADAIPDARLDVYDDATHYLPIEFPARLSGDLRAFFSARC